MFAHLLDYFWPTVSSSESQLSSASGSSSSEAGSQEAQTTASEGSRRASLSDTAHVVPSTEAIGDDDDEDEHGSGSGEYDQYDEGDSDRTDIDELDRETLFFGETPEQRQVYKEWAEKHYPVAVLPEACLPPRPKPQPPDWDDSYYDAVSAGRPLLHYGIGFRVDELVSFADANNLLSPPTRSALVGMYSAEILAAHLSAITRARVNAIRPLSMEYDWVITWQDTSGLFRRPELTKRAKRIIKAEVGKILGEARDPLWWWDDAYTREESDPEGEWPLTPVPPDAIARSLGTSMRDVASANT